MDGGPFRAPQPVERRVPSRQESAPRQAEEPQSVKEATPRASNRMETPRDEPKKRKSFKKVLIPLIIIVAFLGLGFVAWTALTKTQNNVATGIDSSKYQAVFLTSGEVIFGKLKDVNDGYVKLTNIFYLQSSPDSSSDNGDLTKNTQVSSTDAQLIKLGNEAYGPEDEVMISKSQVLKYTNLKEDGKVVQLINKYLKK